MGMRRFAFQPSHLKPMSRRSGQFLPKQGGDRSNEGGLLKMYAGQLPTLKTDFNSLPDDGLLRSSRQIGVGTIEDLTRGQRVYVIDGEGNGCVARVQKNTGRLVLLEPDWASWRSAESETLHVGNPDAGVVFAFKAATERYSTPQPA
jgi:hypothetical protein